MRFAAGLTATGVIGWLLLEALKILMIPVTAWVMGLLAAALKIALMALAVGAALGLLSKLTVFRIKRWSECNTCKICEKKCEWGAIRGPEIVMTECVRCDDCERLYLDTAKCPHWIILRRSPATSRPPSPSAS